MPKPSIEHLRRRFAYDPATGFVTYLIAPNNRVKVGSVAGHRRRSDGYWTVCVMGQYLPLTHVIFAVVKGRWPVQVDHRDRDPSNNRWSNLRESTRSTNMKNAVKKPNQSGFRGVYPHRSTGKFNARISLNGRGKSLGIFAEPADAARAYDAAVVEHYGPGYPTNLSLGLLS